MFEYQFLSNPLCHRPPELPKQPYPLQHLLPPDTSLLKQTKQSLRIQQDTTILNKKIEQAKQLAQKNEQLIAIINQKQTQKSRISKKYNQLMIMYEEIKNNGATLGMEITTQNLVEDNRVLLDKNRKLEREIIQAQKELIRKTKFYEEKNEDSRKLLQKLNQNITKRQQKFKSELSQAQTELRKKSQALSKLQQQYHYLESIHNQKQDQLTKILQQTQRDRSAFSQNISTIESKLQTENNKLNQDLISMKIMVQKVKNQNIDRINQLEEYCHRIQEENLGLKRQYEQAGMYIEQVNSKGVDLDIQCKELENRCKLFEIQVEQLKTKLTKKTSQYTTQLKKSKTLTQHHQYLQQRIKTLQEQLQNISHLYEQSKSQSLILGLQVQKLNKVLQQKIGYITDLQINIQEEHKVRVLASKQCQKLEAINKQVSSLNNSLGKKIANLEELLDEYKGERVRVRREADVKWKEMTDFYQRQIEKLNGKLLSMQAKTNSNSKLSPSKAINLLTNESEY